MAADSLEDVRDLVDQNMGQDCRGSRLRSDVSNAIVEYG